MDHRLIAWARAVKARRAKWPGRMPTRLPPLWLFADPVRLPDPTQAAARLPPGLCGVILRYDRPAKTPAERLARCEGGRPLARICRARRLALHVAGDPWLAQALGAGLHLRRGRRVPGMRRARGRITSSAHDLIELRRAGLVGAAAFLSPCFATSSHPGASGLGPRRWAAIVRRGTGVAYALGGMTGMTARALPQRRCLGAGAISGLVRPT